MDLKNLENRSQELQTKFEGLLGSGEVYYNPPASVRMTYPAIVFSRRRIDNTFANNQVYGQAYLYEVTTITEDPDDPIIGKISMLPMCSFDRHFVNDNLHHNTFSLYH